MSPPAMMRLGLALVAMMSMAVPRALAREGTPNFLIIVTDDQGYADLSAFKHHAGDVHTPNMDRLAARGVLFTDAYLTEIFTDAAIDFLKRHGRTTAGNPKRQRGIEHATRDANANEESLADASGYQKQKKPFFLTLSYNPVHHLIHQSPKRYLDKYGVKEIPNYDPAMGA